MKKLYALLHVYILLTVITCAAWFISCEEKENFIPLKIFSVEPEEALIGDTILITGEGFSPGIEYNRVYFPGVNDSFKPLAYSTEKKLWVQVPEGALPGAITVNLFDEEVTESPVALTVMAPVVESVEPSAGVAGDTVIIRGQNFRPEPEKNKVRFNPVNTTLTNPAGLGKVFSASSTELRVILPQDSRTGKMSVFGFEGTEFTILPPSVTGIEPLTGIVGDTISILGRGFGEAESINIRFKGSGNINGTVLKGSTSRKLLVIVPEDAKDGVIKISYSSIDLVSEQIFEVYPSITNVSPLNGRAGMTITINGYTFSNAKADDIVKFGGLTGEVTSASSTQLKAVVSPGTGTGAVTVEVNGRVATGPVFEISADGTPLILNIQPTSGPVGSLVSIKGDYFSVTASENIVRFGSEDAQAEVLEASKTQLTVKVPLGAINGPVKVIKENKTGTGPNFTLAERALPVITSVSPEFIEPGNSLTIRGGNFTTFANDIDILSPTALGTGTVLKPLTATATEIKATLPANAKVGEWPIFITQYDQNSNNDITITVKGEPQITSLSSPDGFANATLTLTGTEFHNIESKNTVKFSDANGFTVATFTNPSDNVQNKIQVLVPDITPGIYHVTVTSFGNESDPIPFTIKEQPAQVKNIFYSSVLTSPSRVRIEKAFPNLPVQTVYETTAASSAAINSVVVNVADSKAYWYLSTGVIMRNTLDNSNPVQLYSGHTASNDLTLDATNGKLYWSRTANIWRGDVQTTAEGGAAAATIYTAATGTIIRGLTYSLNDHKIYFCEVNTGAGSFNVASIDLDDTPPYTKTPVISGMTLQPLDVKIDETNGKLFILSGAGATSRRTIYMGDLTAPPTQTLTAFHTIQGSTASESLLFGIALDIQDKYLYWIQSKADAVDRPAGVYRKRYDQTAIPGTDPPVIFEKIYDVPEQTSSQTVAGGLAIEESGKSSTQRKKSGTSQRGFSASLTIEWSSYKED